MADYERFSEVNVDGTKVCLDIYEGKRILIGGRFQYEINIRLGMGEVKDRESTLAAFDFFRNYGPMYHLPELKKAWTAYKKARELVSRDTREAFVEFMDAS